MMKVEIIFAEGLAGLVQAPGRRRRCALDRSGPGVRATVTLDEAASLKDVVESLGVPHCEVGQVAGDLTGLDDAVHDGCLVTLEAAAPAPLPDPRFVCDSHLGRLARLLRLLGFDTLWDRDWTEAEIARRGVNEGRTVLSRSRSLLKRKALVRAMLVRSDHPVEQAREAVRRFELAGRARPFGRCSVCNGEIAKVAKDDVAARIPPKTAAWLDEYFECRGCGRLYWEGTHAGPLRRDLSEILGG